MARILIIEDKVVPEGVETVEQSHVLEVMGGDEAQGYLFPRPVPNKRMAEILRERAGGDTLPLV